MISYAEKKASVQQHKTIANYYKFQSKIYDTTRWSFLFGRTDILKQIKKFNPDARRILEVGCGPGNNFSGLSKLFPNAKITGVDISEDMLALAKSKINKKNLGVELIHGSFTEIKDDTQWDAILFSYSLTMINPQWHELLIHAERKLSTNGCIAIVDFYDSRFEFFKNHMSNHHVRMDGHMISPLKENFDTKLLDINNAYGGIWQYFKYIGFKSHA